MCYHLCIYHVASTHYLISDHATAFLYSHIPLLPLLLDIFANILDLVVIAISLVPLCCPLYRSIVHGAVRLLVNLRESYRNNYHDACKDIDDMSKKSYKEEMATLAGHRGWVTREIDELLSLVSIAEETQASIAFDDVKTAAAKLQTRANSYESQVKAVLRAPDITKEGTDDVNERLKDTFKAITRAKREAAALIGDWEEKLREQEHHLAQAGRGTVGEGGNKCKLNNALKPPELTRAYTPSEFRNWRQRFDAYYNDSNMRAADNAVQQQYLMQCLDADIGGRLTDKVGTATPVFGGIGNAGCMDALQDIFRSIHPIPLRRLEVLRMQRNSNEDWPAWSARLRTACREADLATLQPDDLIALIMVTNSESDQLREEFAKLVNPTLAAVEAVGDAWQRRRTMMKTDGAEAKKVQQQQQQNKEPQQSGGGKKKKKSAGNGVSKQSLQGRCYACGSEDHGSRTCANRHTFVCNTCGKKGHKSVVCMSGQSQPAEARQAKPVGSSSAEQAKEDQEEYARAAYYANPPTQAQAQRVYVHTGGAAPPLANPAYAKAARLGRANKATPSMLA